MQVPICSHCVVLSNILKCGKSHAVEKMNQYDVIIIPLPGTSQSKFKPWKCKVSFHVPNDDYGKIKIMLTAY